MLGLSGDSIGFFPGYFSYPMSYSRMRFGWKLLFLSSSDRIWCWCYSVSCPFVVDLALVWCSSLGHRLLLCRPNNVKLSSKALAGPEYFGYAAACVSCLSSLLSVDKFLFSLSCIFDSV